MWGGMGAVWAGMGVQRGAGMGAVWAGMGVQRGAGMGAVWGWDGCSVGLGWGVQNFRVCHKLRTYVSTQVHKCQYKGKLERENITYVGQCSQ